MSCSSSPFALSRPEASIRFEFGRFFLIAIAALALIAVASPTNAREAPGLDGVVADFVLVDKSDRTLTVYADGKVLRVYSNVALGDMPVGHKEFQGDERTPEGRYIIDYGNPQSRYFLSLHINYPNENDRAHARAHGRSPGGAIFIHGQPNGAPDGSRIVGDWTDGCIALSDAEMAELWQIIPNGTPIEIRA
jgi:murein L,D-transpeptidase YafK